MHCFQHFAAFDRYAAAAIFCIRLLPYFFRFLSLNFHRIIIDLPLDIFRIFRYNIKRENWFFSKCT